MSIINTFFVPHPPIIVKEVGQGQEKAVQKTIDAYHEIAKKIALIKPDTIIISSPHSTFYADYFHISPGKKAYGNLGQFGARSVEFSVEYDSVLRDKIVSEAAKLDLPAGVFGEKHFELDHGTILPMYFINQYYSDYKIIRLSPSNLSLIDHYRMGMLINSLVPEDSNVIWVASGDLSHKLKVEGPYGLAKEGKIFDKEFTDAISKGDFLKILNFNPDFYHLAAECGLGSFMMMAGSLDGHDIECKLYSYERTFGVGYAVASFVKKELNKERQFDSIYKNSFVNHIETIRKSEDEYVSLARTSLEYFLKHKKKMSLPDDLSPNLFEKRAGVFVSLHIGDKLRGCIGTIYPTTACVGEEIIQNAISAGTRDYRFPVVSDNELDSIEYSVDVLGEPEPISSESELDVLRYGVIVRHNYKSGLLLPNIDGINSVSEQVDIARRKAGISDNEEYTLERFEVIRHY